MTETRWFMQKNDNKIGATIMDLANVFGTPNRHLF